MDIFLLADVSVNGMAVHGTQKEGETSVSLPGVVPLDIPHLSNLSWELGSRVVTDGTPERVAEFEHANDRWTLSVFDVTENTVVIRIRTSVGRERFYSTIRSELEAAMPKIEAAPAWRRIE